MIDAPIPSEASASIMLAELPAVDAMSNVPSEMDLKGSIWK